jgi:nitrate/nitrite transport system permease protein
MAVITSRRTKGFPLGDLILKNLKGIIPPAVCIFAVLLVWQLLCHAEGSSMPGPLRVIQQTWDPYISKPFFDDGGTSKGLGWQIWISLQRVAQGYSIAAVVGVSMGILIGMVPFVRSGLDPLVQILRTVPPLAWLPISLIIFKDSGPAAIFVIFITAVWPILINTAVGVQQIPQDYNNVAKVLQLPQKDYILNILIPSTIPYMFTGLRIAVGLAWLAIVAAEMLKADGGIGFFIWDAYNSGGDAGNSQIILAIFYVGVVGLLLDRLVGWVGSLLTHDEKN